MKNKRLITLLISICLILVLAATAILTACAAPAPGPAPSPGPSPTPAPTPAKTYKWTMQSIFPPAMELQSISFPKLEEMIESATDGQIAIELHPGGSLVDSREVTKATIDGVLDGCLVVGGYNIGMNPVFGIEDSLPFGIQSDMDCMGLMLGEWKWETPYIDFIRKPYADLGIYYLIASASDSMWVGTKKPINTTADLKGYKIRSWALYAQVLEKLGATVVMSALGETYTGLATGTFDGVNTGTGGFMSLKLWEHLKYFSTPKIGKTPCHIEVNMEKWNELTPELQRVVQETAYHWSLWHVLNVQPLTDTPGGMDFLRSKGCQFVEIKDMDKVRAAAQEVWNDLASGSPEAQQGLKLYTDYMKLKGYL